MHAVELSALANCKKAIRADGATHGVDCVASHVKTHPLVVEYDAETTRIRRDALREAGGENADVLALVNATLVTMHTGSEASDIVHSGAIVMQGGLIRALGKMDDVDVPKGAHVIDVQGGAFPFARCAKQAPDLTTREGYVLPGYIDAHAHWARSFTYPVRNWQYAAMLAYGVTTAHK